MRDEYLSNKRDKLAKVVPLFLRVEMKNLADGIIVVPLLKKFFSVRLRVPLYQVLKLREI